MSLDDDDDESAEYSQTQQRREIALFNVGCAICLLAEFLWVVSTWLVLISKMVLIAWISGLFFCIAVVCFLFTLWLSLRAIGKGCASPSMLVLTLIAAGGLLVPAAALYALYRH